MIEPENLRSASLYINNQLLSRGLLRDGNSIDFAHPGDSDGEVAETMSRIMAVVNDLILRRDRDAEHRESLSATLRTLRAESLRQANDIQRLQEKHAEAQRKVGLSEAAEAALRTHLKSAEATVHRLKEEAARTKTLVAQTRASCANEVRKRDRQIESLKKAVREAGRARGAGKGTAVTSITVVGDVGSEAEPGLPAGRGVADQSYDLRSETNAFLAELAKGLSEENEALLDLVRRTTEQLKEMSGWEVTNGTPIENGDGHALAIPSNPAEMSMEIDAVLEHLRTILTNPSFVPIEEVVVREDEIHRLRDGWEKMETRWKEAVHLIDGWRKRMQASGRPVNVEELKMGLRLSPVKVNNVEETAHGFDLRLDALPEHEDEEEEADAVQQHCDEELLDLAPQPELDDGESDASSVFDHNVDVDDLDVEEPNVEILQQSVMMTSASLHLPHQSGPLRDSASAANGSGRPEYRRQPRSFTTITEERTPDLAAEDAPLPPPPSEERPQQSPQKKPLLSLRPVPPEEAAGVALPPSAVVSTPDTSVENTSFNLNKPVDEPTAPTGKPTTTSLRTQTRPISPAKKKESTKREATKRGEREPVKPTTSKPTSKPPAKARPTRPPITRGRSETRKDETGSHPTKRPPRAASATSAKSAASATSAASTRSTGANKSANTGSRKTAPPSPAPESTQSPSRSPRRVNSRLPLPRPGCNGVLPAPQQSPLTMDKIAAKLAASEREADAARVRAKLKAARLGKGVSLPPPGAASTTSNTAAEAEGTTGTRSESDSVTGSTSASASMSDGAPSSATTASRDEDIDELGLSPPPGQQPQKQQQQSTEERKSTRKRERRTSKVASRRRSTLQPWELDALIQGGKVTVER
ncbi:Afadin and alpha-actinin-binding-domain-containing protein [Achaetomium macrosporum]|uniref:Afadin and alpha-actinin-binding-domain-containing protein n=1 Tax=Achaetomium macrosporum TaxID=79813 RepID=A0AAN7HI97_9PEZI|nr:Afadin and alpha-actinin-binding-domain-containing protein [Achaetomium macrosporum]